MPSFALTSPSSPNFKPLSSGDEIFVTDCCHRPICPACVRANPRLVRYNPCLHCLGGVGAVSAGSRTRTFQEASGGGKGASMKVNVDGGVRDEDVFVLGDDDDEVEDEDRVGDNVSTASDSPSPATPPPAYTDVVSPLPSAPSMPSKSPSYAFATKDSEAGPSNSEANSPQPNGDSPSPSSGPQRYYIQPTDTLVGIALRFHVDGRLLCRLNHLPPSTLRTTPHLLHTRAFLDLPPNTPEALLAGKVGVRAVNGPSTADEARRARERAESRFRTFTKEADYRVARAYVAVADIDDSDAFREDEMKKASAVASAAEKLRKRHPSSPIEGGGEGSGLEVRAVDRYLDDEEWEERQRRDGRGVGIPAFPLFGGVEKPADGKKTWWRW
ncbi:uncharacterized protein B0H18DRAFT_1084397 [Fomitopsis serialis]|uniref:uncharacterized protein n=1 Tax=Fomitopsis serialis TaxID=139415 RepID=UPI0020088049|nr:uncharacterized protein B0H18DRAFT_1084397 [Neoantrodia serialis]KAH9928643.1 hypothetical protein B0H18DRAFT_1084397 [Neoantrodia serialis]